MDAANNNENGIENVVEMSSTTSTESELNIEQCVMCGNLDVPNVDLELPLKTNNQRFRSITIRGARCTKCGEKYYEIRDTDAIKKIENLLNDLLPLN